MGLGLIFSANILATAVFIMYIYYMQPASWLFLSGVNWKRLVGGGGYVHGYVQDATSYMHRCQCLEFRIYLVMLQKQIQVHTRLKKKI